MGEYTLPELSYPYDALEPHIDARTMEIHHSKHHQSYVDKLNAALEGHTDLSNQSVEDLLRNFGSVPGDLSTPVRNHGGGHANHTLFWTIIGPDGGGEPSGALSDAINDSFGSFKDFQQQFTNTATGVFGSGWAWLVASNGNLVVYGLPNQDSPLTAGETPILGLDVWEHAYYLKYQNKRPEYVEAWWNVVNWEEVGRRFEEASGG